MPSDSLVCVVIPAYNAQAELDETLRSARAQTHANLEIIVVDDGSKDRTAEVAERHAAADPRVRLIRQANGGVAAARNRAIAESRAELIAPLDADDLWTPDKVEKQLRALDAAGEKTVLAYSWQLIIDPQSRILDDSYQPKETGDVLKRMFTGNLPGNASSPLIRKGPLLAVGGYDPSLRARKAQGCEDLLVYFRLAELGPFVLVPEQQIGYRRTPQAMSSDVMQMMRSWRIVADEMQARHPEFAREIELGGDYIAYSLLERALEAGQMTAFAKLMARLMTRNPRLVVRTARQARWRRRDRRKAPGIIGSPFPSGALAGPA